MAAIAGIIGTLSGAWLSWFLGSRTRAQEVREQRRKDLEATLTELLVACRAKLSAAEIFVVAAAQPRFDLVEFVETDAGKQMLKRESRIDLALTRLALNVGDSPLRRALDDLELCLTDFPDKAYEPPLKRGVNAIGESYSHIRQTRTALSAVEAAAAPLLAVQLDPE